MAFRRPTVPAPPRRSGGYQRTPLGRGTSPPDLYTPPDTGDPDAEYLRDDNDSGVSEDDGEFLLWE